MRNKDHFITALTKSELWFLLLMYILLLLPKETIKKWGNYCLNVIRSNIIEETY